MRRSDGSVHNKPCLFRPASESDAAIFHLSNVASYVYYQYVSCVSAVRFESEFCVEWYCCSDSPCAPPSVVTRRNLQAVPARIAIAGDAQGFLESSRRVQLRWSRKTTSINIGTGICTGDRWGIVDRDLNSEAPAPAGRPINQRCRTNFSASQRSSNTNKSATSCCAGATAAASQFDVSSACSGAGASSPGRSCAS